MDYSLARRTESGLLLHRLVQSVTRTHPTGRHRLPAVLDLLHAELPAHLMDAPQNWPTWRRRLVLRMRPPGAGVGDRGGE